MEPDESRIRVQRDEYKRLAVQPRVDTGVMQLGVTGVLEARDAADRPHVLLGLRSRQTRVFGGMWELAPSGGVDPPGLTQTSMEWMDLWRAFESERREEIGGVITPSPTPPAALYRDDAGSSLEVVFHVPIGTPVDTQAGEMRGAAAWEYDAVRWTPVDQLAAFGRTEPVSPPTRKIWRALGWV